MTDRQYKVSVESSSAGDGSTPNHTTSNWVIAARTFASITSRGAKPLLLRRQPVRTFPYTVTERHKHIHILKLARHQPGGVTGFGAVEEHRDPVPVTHRFRLG